MGKKDDNKLWFGSKKYGYGWVPSTIQGWLSVGLYGLFVAMSTIWLSNQHDEPQTTYNLLYTAGMLISTGILVGVSRLKGPKAKWRWGSKDNDNT